MLQYLMKIREWAEDVEGQWNGDESGIQEDRAMLARDIKEKVDELQELLDKMDTLL